MKYSQPRLSSAAATRNATSSAETASIELLMPSRGVGRHVAEQPARAVVPVQPHREANAKLVVVRPWVASADARERELTDRLAQPHRCLEPLLRRHAPEQLVVACVRLRRGVDHRHTA